jgi:hypothetical protein
VRHRAARFHGHRFIQTKLAAAAGFQRRHEMPVRQAVATLEPANPGVSRRRQAANPVVKAPPEMAFGGFGMAPVVAKY